MNSSNITPPNPVAFVTPLLVAAAVFAYYLAVSSGNVLMIFSVMVAPLLLLLPGRLNLCFSILFILCGSELYIPGFPTEFTMRDFLGVFVLFVLVVRHALVREGLTKGVAPNWMFVAFAGVLIVTMFVRGLGFRQLGGTQVGGMGYVRVLVVSGLYVMSGPIRLDRRQWKAAFIGLCLIAFLPALSDALYVLSGGKIYQLYRIVRPSDEVLSTLDIFQSGGGILRFKRLPGRELFLLGLILFPWARGRKLIVVVFGLVGLLFAGFTGFRLRLLDMFLFIGILSFISSRNRRVLLALKVGAAVLVGLLLIGMFATKLPLAVQRTLSWIPMIPISETAKVSAMGSTDWRLQLWRQMFAMIPDYVFVGRGMAFELNPYSPILNQLGFDRYRIGWALITHNYHNGPAGLLLDLGLLGLILPTLIFGTAAWRFYRISQAPWDDAGMRWLFRLLYARFAASLIVFYLLYGDLRVMFPQILYTLLFLEIMSRSRQIDPEDTT